jgi:hypothetical protein
MVLSHSISPFIGSLHCIRLYLLLFQPNTISYQNWVILKIATNRGHQFVHFHAYCNYDVMSNTMTEGMEIVA